MVLLEIAMLYIMIYFGLELDKITYSKGTTKYSDSTSTNSLAYPNNQRHTDGYWYVYKGVQ